MRGFGFAEGLLRVEELRAWSKRFRAGGVGFGM